MHSVPNHPSTVAQSLVIRLRVRSLVTFGFTWPRTLLPRLAAALLPGKKALCCRERSRHLAGPTTARNPSRSHTRSAADMVFCGSMGAASAAYRDRVSGTEVHLRALRPRPGADSWNLKTHHAMRLDLPALSPSHSNATRSLRTYVRDSSTQMREDSRARGGAKASSSAGVLPYVITCMPRRHIPELLFYEGS